MIVELVCDDTSQSASREFLADLHNHGLPKEMGGCNRGPAADRITISSYL